MMNSNPASLPSSWARPAGYVSLRQELAKRHGTVHFKPLGISMAPAGPSTPSPRSTPSSSYSSSASFDLEEQQARGRSSSVRPLWAYSPSDDVQAALDMEGRRWSADTIVPPAKATTVKANASTSAVATTSAVQPASPLNDDAAFEQPTGSTSSLPILSRPPPLASASSPLEQQAEYAEAADGDESEATSYLAPPQWATSNGAGPGTKVLYTRAQLPELDDASRHLWHALHHFRALPKQRSLPADHPPVLVSPSSSGIDASSCPFSREGGTEDSALVSSTFNWSSLWLPEHVEGQWYGVVFRSLRKPGSESLNLYEADRLSHEEAVGSGGLIAYWYGEPDVVTGENLATCVWTSREVAIEASRLPRHKEAVGHAMKAYSYFRLTRYKVVKRRGEHHVRVETWDEE